MARRVFLHIGAPKTGTTFLQTVMWTNRESLKRAGLLYPGRRRFDKFLFYERVREMARDDPMVTRTWDEMIAEVSAWDGDALLSHEFFAASATAEQAAWAIAQFQPAEVHLIFTARDYVRLFPGVWLEALKMGSGRSFDQFVADALEHDTSGVWSWATQDAPVILQRWSETLPHEHVHVITLPRPGAPRDLLWTRWCGVLGIDPATVDLKVALPNESLGLAQAALLARVQPRLSGPLRHKPVAYRWFRAYFAETVLSAQAGQRFGLAAEDAERFAELSRQAADAIGKAGYDIVGDLSELAPQPPVAGLPPVREAAETDMLDAAAQAIERMLRDLRRVTAERDRLREQVRSGGAVAARADRLRGAAGRWAATGVSVARRMRRRIRSER